MKKESSYSGLTSSEDKKLKFIGLLDFMRSNPSEYCKVFSEIRKWDMKDVCDSPKVEELRQYFQNFMLNNQAPDSESLIKYWNKYHVTVLMFILAHFKLQSSISPWEYNDQDWHQISEFLPCTSAESLKYKWLSLQHKGKKYPNFWTSKDDRILIDTVEEKAPILFDPLKSITAKVRWSLIAMHFNFVSQGNKLGKHCKERWFNHLSPFINKSVWTDQEDILLLENAIIHDKHWSKMAMAFPGRTQHNVKNRFMSLIAREHQISTKVQDFNQNCDKSLIQKTLSNLKKRNQNIVENSRNEEILVEFRREETFNNPLEIINRENTSEEIRKKDIFLFDGLELDNECFLGKENAEFLF